MGEGDNAYREFKGFKWTRGNEDVPALALVVDHTSRQLHITEPLDVKTDWDVAVCTHPTVYIHSATTPATSYIKLWNDGTYGYLGVNGSTILTSTASALTVTPATTLSSTLGVAGTVTLTGTTSVLFNPTLVPDANRTNYIWSYGTRATAKDLAMAASTNYNLDPIQINLNITGTAPTSSTVNLSYMKIAHTIDMTALRLKCSDWNVTIANDILDAYVYQGEIDITASTAIGGEACGLGLTMSVSAGTVTGLVRGLVILMSGASMPANAAAMYVNVGGGTTLTHGLLLATQGGTTLSNALYFEDGGTITNIFKFAATSAAVVSKSNSSGAQSYTVRCAVGGVTGYIRLFAD